jgi:hypothetical protein
VVGEEVLNTIAKKVKKGINNTILKNRGEGSKEKGIMNKNKNML